MQIQATKQLVVRKYMDVNEHERLSSLETNLKEQLVVRKDMDVNEHERLFNITLRHKFKQRNSVPIADLHFTDTIGSYIYIAKLIPKNECETNVPMTIRTNLDLGL